jgi:hypothetical protein
LARGLNGHGKAIYFQPACWPVRIHSQNKQAAPDWIVLGKMRGVKTEGTPGTLSAHLNFELLIPTRSVTFKI